MTYDTVMIAVIEKELCEALRLFIKVSVCAVDIYKFSKQQSSLQLQAKLMVAVSH